MHSILDVDFPYKYSKIEKRKERERVRGCRFHIIIEVFRASLLWRKGHGMTGCYSIACY